MSQRGDLLAHRVPRRLADHDREHVALGNSGQVRGVADADLDVAPRVLVHARVGPDVGRQRDRGMIHQPLADAGQGGDHLDAHVAQMPDRSDARAQQMRRRMNRAARQDHLARAELGVGAVDRGGDADTTRAVEDQRLHLRVGRDAEVGPLARGGVEVAHRGGDALLLGVGMRDREIAVDELAVLVGQELHARELAGLAHGLRVPGPVLDRDAPHRGCGPPCRDTARRSRGRARPS